MKSMSIVVSLFLLLAVPSGFCDLIFEDDFNGANADGLDPVNWQWWLNPDLIWIQEESDVPEYGPNVMVLGGDTGGTAHIGLEVEETKDLTDYRMTVLWVDRLVNLDANDADFHFGLRCQEYDPEIEVPESCYEVEVDGDDNDSANVVPEDGPTSFHIFIRGGAGAVNNDGNALDHATRSEVPRPVSNQWYWTSMEVQGYTVRAKQWNYGDAEPDWQLEAEDLDQQFASGGVRIGVWSGLAHVAYVRLDTVDATDVHAWELY